VNSYNDVTDAQNMLIWVLHVESNLIIVIIYNLIADHQIGRICYGLQNGLHCLIREYDTHFTAVTNCFLKIQQIYNKINIRSSFIINVFPKNLIHRGVLTSMFYVTYKLLKVKTLI